MLVAVLLTGHPLRAAEEEAPGSAHAVPVGPVFVKLPPINIPVITGNRVSAQVGISLTLELVDGQTKADIEPKQRQLADAFITDLYAIFQHWTDPARPVDGAVVKERLRRTADRILGPGVVKDVLIIHLLQQPRR